ncbi:DUF4142 domain-containing protein [Gloeobacter kilaueensis]|uniref:DUF4142 domain-containing protein n=1 Tax=Gloeobacter kilaueensis (strain ATCC BAA-2537 / CCAP 1431/1 / ULC 316 / JS1) TaxID=1183438 RepID=U5QKV9_GLOK1|nr:DUF4142 domain-containing protein [Gloeobacter kilaueensis]AGY59561.1 hypothetical protein GKIL_3315 [Gloeobacter kilaueensis JS1]
MGKQTIFSLASALTFITLVVALPVRAQEETTVIQRTETVTTSPATASGAAYLSAMAEFGVREVTLAGLALKHSNNPTVRQYATDVLTYHERTDHELQLLAASKRVTVPATGSDLTAPAKDKLQSLLARLQPWSGSRFDQEYLNLAYFDQREALRLSRAAAEQSRDSDIQNFASRNLETLQTQTATADTLAKKLPG